MRLSGICIAVVAVIVIIVLIIRHRRHVGKRSWRIYRASFRDRGEAEARAIHEAILDRADVPNATAMDHLYAAGLMRNRILEIDEGEGHVDMARRELFDEMRRHIGAAVHAVPLEVGIADNKQDGKREDANYIIDIALEFAYEGIAELARGQYPHGGVITDLADMAGDRHARLTRARQEAARAEAEDQGGGATADAYLATVVRNTTDPQNVHDSTVTAGLRATMQRLRADQKDATLPGTPAIIADIEREGLRWSEGRPAKVSEALKTIERIREGEKMMKIDATDEECLQRVWLRADDPRNSANRDLIRRAVFDCLVDSWEDGPGYVEGDAIGGRHIVCVTGRATRLLASLSLLDWDERNWGYKRLEQLRNEIYKRARSIIDEKADNASKSADPDRRAAGMAALATTSEELQAAGQPSAEAEEKLAEETRAAIAEMVDAYVREVNQETPDAIPEYLVASIKSEAAAAVV